MGCFLHGVAKQPLLKACEGVFQRMAAKGRFQPLEGAQQLEAVLPSILQYFLRPAESADGIPEQPVPAEGIIFRQTAQGVGNGAQQVFGLLLPKGGARGDHIRLIFKDLPYGGFQLFP